MIKTSFSIDISRAMKKLDKAGVTLTDFREPLKETKDYALQEIKKQFATGGSNIGSGWKPRKKAYSHRILDKTGRLKKSFKQVKLTKTEMHITSPVDYFKFHQLGTSKMPQRQILGFSSKMKKEIIRIFNAYIRKHLK